MPGLGKIVFILGVVLAVLGLVLMFGPKIPWLGRLPGDIVIKRDNFTLYFPIATSILLSVVLSLILRLFGGK